MTFKKYLPTFPPPIPSAVVQGGTGKRRGWVCTAKAQWPVLEALPLVEPPAWGQRGTSLLCPQAS